MPRTDRLRRRNWPAMLVLLSAWAPGCTSVLSTASLRDLVWDGGEPHASEAASAASDDAAAAQTSIAGTSSTDSEDAADSESLDAERREAAVNEAVERLAKLGSIDPATRATLMATLDRTQPEDWPAVIEAFTESLPAAEPEPHAHTAAKAELDADAVAAVDVPASKPTADPKPTSVASATSDPTPAADHPAQPPAPSLTAAVEPAPEPAASVADPVAPAPPDSAAPDASLAVENACFATRVQGWGVVDRFAADRFRPGQDVIVYFELAGLSASESPAGHTTCIDSTLRLVAADGTVLHAWSFEPIAESCRARRHDYFARYVVRLPETAAAGACRLELGVTDTLSGQVASATLPLELLPPLAAR